MLSSAHPTDTPKEHVLQLKDWYHRSSTASLKEATLKREEGKKMNLGKKSCLNNHKQEAHHKHTGERGSDLTLGMFTGNRGPHNIWLQKSVQLNFGRARGL